MRPNTAEKDASLVARTGQQGISFGEPSTGDDLQVEIISDAPTEAEIKAVKDFFNWLFAWVQDEKNLEGVES